MALSHPEIIQNRYKVYEQIGSGGMGTVFSGVDNKSGEPVAIKILKSDVAADDPDIITRFQREAEALRQLNHPGIVKVIDFVVENDQHFIMMEHVKGGTLGDIVKHESKMPVKRILKIAIELADALTRAHYLKIVHRDLKPANVLMTREGTPRLTDFGVAYMGKKERITQVDVAVGTPDYMSPEALKGESVDARSDIWSFGVILFEMLTRRHPFAGDRIGQLITAILTEQPPDIEELRPDAPVQLVDLVYRMLDKDKNARIPSIRLVGAELEMIMQGGDENTSSIYAARLPVPIQTDRFATPTPSTSEAKHNLPAQVTPFVGRESELSEIDRLVHDPDVRLITILGPGGMGKTRLSLEAAKSQISNFFHGVYFVPLAPLERPENIIPTIAESVNFSFGQDPRGPKAQLLDFLHEKNILLVMDNYEHVIEGANFVSEILQMAPDVTIIVTSRERLRLSGETVFNLGGMDFPDWETPEDAMEYSAVKLFLQGARRALPGYEIENDDLTYIARIARLLQGMPLGILLAAAWLDSLALHEITEEINTSLDFLETDMRDIPDRHKSIRAVFDYSWNLLNNRERDVFTKLSIFRGGFEREAGQRVADASLRDLNSLVNKSLIIRDPKGRFSLHKLLQQYAEEKFNCCNEDEASVKAKHATYYGHFLQKLESQFGGKNELVAIETIDIELDNLRVAWHWAVDHKKWEQLEPILHTTMLFYQGRSMLMEGITAFRELAESLEADDKINTNIYWKARTRHALLAGRLADYDTGWKYSKAGYDYFLDKNEAFEISNALNIMAYSRMYQGKYEEAKRYSLEGAEWAQKADDTATVWGSLANAGYVDFLSGNYAEAKRVYTNLMNNNSDDTGSPIGRAFGLNNLGEIHQALGDLEEAKELFDQAFDIFKSYRHRRGMAFSTNNIAGIHFVMGQNELAKDMYKQAYDLNKEIGDQSGIAHSISAMGNLSFLSGDPKMAEHCYTESLNIRRNLGDPRGVADSLSDLGNVALAIDNPEVAKTHFDESLKLRIEIGDRQGEGTALIGLGIAVWLLGDEATAENHIQQSLAMADDVGNSMMMIQALSVIGDIHFDKGEVKDAKGFFYKALRIGQSMGSERVAAFPILGLAQIMEREGDKQRALELITLVDQFDHHYIKFVGDRINRLSASLKDDLDAKSADEAIQRGKQLVATDVVSDLLNNMKKA